MPVDTQAMMVPSGQGPQGGGGATIPLSTLIDYIIQRTYHELNVLSELLPRKSDMERKIEIVQFASRTRQLFVRLLALVKWASSAGKVDKCAMISGFLDKQANLFVNTADMLSNMARETLTKARLPSFSIPCAIDVLTTGTYPRLPVCIKEKIVPPDPITTKDKNETLLKLNQIIEHRLVTGELPRHMRRPHIYNGRVKFRVEHEFEVTLTLMGDGPHIPWRLLNIAFLVEDPETGGGMTLVHSLQVNYIHQLVQSRLLDNDRPLHDLYNVMHSFCQSLQLEVLHSQAKRLIQLRLGDHVRAEEYRPGKSLILSYWRARMLVDKDKATPQVFKLTIHVDEQEPSKPLQVSHHPQIQGSESTKVAQAIRSDYLSVEKLLMNTIQVRGLSRLRELERELRVIVPGPCEIRDLPTVLYVPVLYPCMQSERLAISIDVQKGAFLVSLSLKVTDLTEDIENSVNSDKRELRRLLSKLRLYVALRRCEKSIQHIHTTVTEHLPFIQLHGHALEQLGKNKLFIKLPKHNHHYLVVEATETYKRCVAYKYYLLQVHPSCFEDATQEEQDTLPKLYIRPGHLVELDEFSCTHSSGAKIYDIEPEDPNMLTRKRKLFKKDNSGPQQKKVKPSSYFVPQIPHILALCEDRLLFVLLGKQLEKRKIAFSDIELDGEGIGLSLSVLGLLSTDGLEQDVVRTLGKNLLSCKLRMHHKGGRPMWHLEAIFCNCPVKSSSPKEKTPVFRVYFVYDICENAEKTVNSILDDWTAVSHLYQAVCNFAHVYQVNARFQNELEIRSYNYKKLILAYGPNNCYTTTVSYKSSEKAFAVTVGTTATVELANSHSLIASHLQAAANDDKNIVYLAQLLLDTWAPYSSMGKLSTAPSLGIRNPNSPNNIPTSAFTIIPQSATHIRVMFREMYCLDVHLRANRVVAVRDGAFSMFDTGKVVEGLTPIPGFKAFLNLFVDESMSSSHARRRSTTEDDHPPSPVGMDDGMDRVMAPHISMGSPAGKQFRSPLTPMSNPATPTSPASKMQAHQSPGASFPLTSPPSLSGIVPSPSSMMDPSPGSANPTLHVPSPGSAFVPAPSPSSLGIHMPSPASQFVSPQGIIDGANSPYHQQPGSLTMPSPGPAGWPPSPSMPRPSPRQGAVTSPLNPANMMSPPSRTLPQRSWAASIPTLISHEALDKLLTPGPLPATSRVPGPAMSPLERFLSCVYMRKHIHKAVQNEKENLHIVQSQEAGVVLFKNETLNFRVSLHPTHLQSLHLKVSAPPEYSGQWESEETQLIERFFELKVACAPYKMHPVTALCRLLSAPLKVLKDFVQIMKLELMPDKNCKWGLTWCLTTPHGTPLTIDVGVAAIVRSEKILFVLRLTHQAPPAGADAVKVVVPVLHNLAENSTILMETRGSNDAPNHSRMQVAKIFEKYNQIHMSQPQTQKECSIFPAVQKMLYNLPDPPYQGAAISAAAARHADPAANTPMAAQKINA